MYETKISVAHKKRTHVLQKFKRECIPVGCLLPALYHTGGGSLCPGRSLARGVSVQGGSMSEGVSVRGTLSRQTPVKILPCAKLRLLAVRKENVGNPKRKYNM